MQQRAKFLEKTRITERQALLTTLALYFVGTILLMVIRLRAQPHNVPIPPLAGLIGTFLFGGAWFLYYKYNWEPVRYFAATTTTLLVALFLPQPFVTFYAPMALLLPIVLSLIVAGTLSVILNSILLIAILLVRSGGSGVYAQPLTLTIYAMIVGGLLVKRLIDASSLYQLKQAQATVKQSEQQMRALVASLDDILFQFDEQGTYLNVWTADESLLFQPKEQLLGKRITEVLGTEAGHQFEDAVRRVASSGQPENMEYSLDVIGGRRWFNARINLIFDPGAQRTVSMLIRDVTERKHAETVLHVSEARYRLLFEENPLPLWVYDTVSLRFLAVNDAAIAQYGYERDEFLQMTIREIRPPEELPRLEGYLSQPRPQQERSGPWKYRKKDGTLIDVEVISNETFFLGVPARLVLTRDITEQLQAKAALATSELRFRSLIENSADGITVVGYQGMVTYVSPSIERLLGYTPEEAIGRRAMDFVHREDRLRLMEHVARLHRAGTGQQFLQYRFKHKDGSWRWLESTLAHQADDGMGRGIVFNYRDVTERKQAEKELETLYSQLRNLFDNLDEVFFSIDTLHWKTLQMSPACETIFGYPPSAFFENPQLWRQVIHPDDLCIIEENFPKLYTGESVLQEYRIYHANGELHWVEAKLKPMLDTQGNLIRADGIVSDITGRKQAESDLQASESRYRLATRATNDVIWEWNAITNQLSWAENAQIVFGYSPEEIGPEATWWDDHIHPEDRQRVTYGVNKLINGSESVWLDEYRFQIKDGSYAIISDHGYVERDANGKAIRLIGAMSDITERRQVEEELRILNLELEERVAERTRELNRTNAELEHASRAKDEFLANMSHELRTPLNSILGLSESLLEQRRGPLNEHQQKSLRVIEASGTHLLALINDILDLSKIEAGKFDFYPETILVDDLIQSSLAFVKSQALKKSIKLSYEPDPKVSRIHADPRRLKQILVNLLTNAVKFTPEQGQILLQVQANEGEELIQFSVSDTGIGIAAEDLERLFRPFEQVDSQLNRQFEGTGLGLALVQKLTDLHGGSVHVTSEVGKGSCFTINLPWEKEIEPSFAGKTSPERNASTQESSLAPKKSVTPITILLAEDHVANILTIGEYLESHGYQVIVAHDGVEALEKAQEADPDLILMDIQMPVIDGLQATSWLRTQVRFAHTPIIALTALAMPGDRERCLLAGANEYMSKPVSLSSLLKTIQQLLLQYPHEKRAGSLPSSLPSFRISQQRSDTKQESGTPAE